MVWQLVALIAAALLILAGVALLSVPAALIVAGVGVAVLFLDLDVFRKGGKP